MTIYQVRSRGFKDNLDPSPVSGKTIEVTSPTLPPPSGYASHPPMRALPVASTRLFDDASPAYYISPTAGASGNGSGGSPWKTFSQAAAGTTTGDTVYLLDGIHRGIGNLSKAGITVRAAPGALAIIDTGIQEFYDDPDTAWEPVPSADGGVDGEYRSVNQYPSAGVSLSLYLAGGNFGDSMVPLFRYENIMDLRTTDNELKWEELENHNFFTYPDWVVRMQRSNAEGGSQADRDSIAAYLALYGADGPNNNYTYSNGEVYVHIYCGPGIIWQPTSGNLGRFHIRLAPTTIHALNVSDYLRRGISANYTGEEDPRNLPLIICKGGISMRGNNLTVQDLVIRGTANECKIGEHGETGIEVDGLTYYHGTEALGLNVRGSGRLTNCKFRGSSSPWASRFTEKNRADATTFVNWNMVTTEMDHCELTDHHDGAPRVETKIVDFDFHHNLVDNMNDDGMYLQCRNIARVGRIWQNIFGACNQIFPFIPGPFTSGHMITPPEVGLYIYRNFFDMRRYTYGQPPLPSAPLATDMMGQPQLTMEHGNSTRPNVYFYHNDILLSERGLHDAYMANWGKDYDNSVFRIYNNIMAFVSESINQSIQTLSGDFASRNNLQYSKTVSIAVTRTGDINANPLFTAFPDDWADTTDLSLQAGSPALGAGFLIPSAWPDVLRDYGSENPATPTIGAVPVGAPGTIFGPGATV